MDKNDEAGAEVAAKIETFSDAYRDTARELHALIMETAPQLHPRLWYNMPGYAIKPGGPVVAFFREDKYISFGLTDSTNLEKIGNPDETMVNVAWYLTKLDAESRKKISDVIRNITS